MVNRQTPIPCRFLFPDVDEQLFSPGIQIQRDDGLPLASVRLSPESRYQGFWKFTGQKYQPWNLVMEFRRDSLEIEASLRVSKPSSWSRVQFSILDSHGIEWGSLELRTSAMRSPRLHDRIILKNLRDEAIGEIDIRCFYQWNCHMVDSVQNRTYEFDFSQYRLNSQQADSIDGLMILAFAYYFRIYRTATES